MSCCFYRYRSIIFLLSMATLKHVWIVERLFNAQNSSTVRYTVTWASTWHTERRKTMIETRKADMAVLADRGRRGGMIVGILYTKISVADKGRFSRIPEPNFYIPELNFFHPGSPASKNLSILTKKTVSSSRKYDPGCSSWIRILILYLYTSRIPYPGVKKAPDPGYGSATLLKITVIYSKL